MMLGYLLARAGVEVMVLEKHADFLRDFRGDTIHPSTLEIMHELGLLDEFLKRPHQELRELAGQIGEDRVVLADFSHLPTRCRFIAFMPQWDFLDFLADEAKAYPSFSLRMQAEVTDLVQDGDTVVGVRAKVPEGTLDVQADLVVGADGRHSAVRDLAGLEVEDLGAPMDALWMRLSKRPEDGTVVLGRIQAGHLFVMLDRGDYWQCAFVIPKGGFAELRRRGLPAFRAEIVKLNPALANRVQEIKSWDDVKLLTVRVDRLKRWYKPGVAVHRRRGARHVAGRRRRHQSRRSGRGRRRQYSRRAAQERAGPGRAARQGAAAAGMADAHDAGGADLRAEPHHQQCSRHADPAARALRGEAAQPHIRGSAAFRRGSSAWASAPSTCKAPS